MRGVFFHHFNEKRSNVFLDKVHFDTVRDGISDLIDHLILLKHLSVIIVGKVGHLDQSTGQAVLSKYGIVIGFDRSSVRFESRDISDDVVVKAASEKEIVLVVAPVILFPDRKIRTLELGIFGHLAAFTLDNRVVGDIEDRRLLRLFRASSCPGPCRAPWRRT